MTRTSRARSRMWHSRRNGSTRRSRNCPRYRRELRRALVRRAETSAAVSITSLRRWWRRPITPLLGIAALKFAIHLATNGVYGFQRDEMYYIISGQHPALGYVDYPPVTPMLASLNTSIFGISPWTLRLFPSVAGAAVVLLAGMCAREMGGRRAVSML